jgi:cyclase
MSAWPFGDFPPGGLEPLGPHTMAFYASGFPYANSAIVAGSDSILVFDANIFHYGKDLKAAVDHRHPGLPVQLVISHAHADHTDGSMYFVPPARSLATEFTRGRLAWWRDQDQTARNAEYQSAYPQTAEWYRDFRMVIPEQTVGSRKVIDLGGSVSVQLLPEGPAHTVADLWGLVEPDGVALCGDLWFNNCEPYLASGSIDGSLAAITHLRSAQARVYLPGHGRAGQLQDGDRMERFCRWIQERVRAGLERGHKGEELQRAVRAEFEAESRDPNGIRFAFTWPDFLEQGVAAEELVIAGDPLYKRIETKDPG